VGYIQIKADYIYNLTNHCTILTRSTLPAFSLGSQSLFVSLSLNLYQPVD
jgi:hypothetical protein